MGDYDLCLMRQEEQERYAQWCAENPKIARRQAITAALMLIGLFIEIAWLLQS